MSSAEPMCPYSREGKKAGIPRWIGRVIFNAALYPLGLCILLVSPVYDSCPLSTFAPPIALYEYGPNKNTTIFCCVAFLGKGRVERISGGLGRVL